MTRLLSGSKSAVVAIALGLALAGCAEMAPSERSGGAPVSARVADAPPSAGAVAGAAAAGASAVRADEEDALPGGARSRAPYDPLEPWNRGVARFNDALDDAVFRPVAKVYDRYAPEVLRMIGRNVLSNLLDPYIALNNFLQGKPADGFSDIGRFLLNSTFGFFGFGDPASDIGLRKHREDFGQTLGVWGAPPGPFLVLPFFGPSNVRDGIGFAVDTYGSPISQTDSLPLRIGVYGADFIDTRARLLQADGVLADALDRYLLIRDGYLQRRRNLIYDGNPPDND